LEIDSQTRPQSTREKRYHCSGLTAQQRSLQEETAIRKPSSDFSANKTDETDLCTKSINYLQAEAYVSSI
jgi:hypothetical protein